MLLAAELGALAAESAGFLGAEPDVAQEAGDRVLLGAERRDPPGVDHVGGGGDDAHLLADRHHHLVVDLEQVVLALRRLALDLLARRAQGRDEADALAFAFQVVVAPFPLVAGHLDGEVRRRGVLLRDHRFRHRPGDDDQDQRRDDGPEDLDRGVLVELLGLVADRAAVRVAGVEHEAEHADEDHQDDPHHHLVQPVDLGRHLRRRRLEVPGDRVRRTGRRDGHDSG